MTLVITYEEAVRQAEQGRVVALLPIVRLADGERDVVMFSVQPSVAAAAKLSLFDGATGIPALGAIVHAHRFLHELSDGEVEHQFVPRCP